MHKIERKNELDPDPEGLTGEALLAFINGELFPKLKELTVAGAEANRARVVKSVFEDAYNYMKSGQLMSEVGVYAYLLSRAEFRW